MQYCRKRFAALRLLIPPAALVGALLLTACGGGGAAATPTAAAKVAPAGDPQLGQQAVQKYGCGSCHVIPGVAGATGTAAPSLAGFANKPQIAQAVPNTPDNLVRWIQNPQAVKANTAMPNVNVTEPDARNIAAFLLTLK